MLGRVEPGGRGGDIFHGGLLFSIKNNLKSEIFNDKNQEFRLRILTKNVVTLKRWEGN